MSWAYRITILTFGFVCFISFLVISAFRQNVDLVTENYYAKELQFESQIEKQKNVQQLNGILTVSTTEKEVVISYPESLTGTITGGTLLIFRPSDASKDFTVSVKADSNGIQTIPITQFSKGQYRLQADYRAAGKNYYSETVLIIP